MGHIRSLAQIKSIISGLGIQGEISLGPLKTGLKVSGKALLQYTQSLSLIYLIGGPSISHSFQRMEPPHFKLGGFKTGEVIESRGLVDMTFEGAQAKHHIEIRLPAGASYEAGDYLGVLAGNPMSQTKRVLRHFGLLADSLIMLESGHEGLPLHRPVSCEDLITHYVELVEPAKRSQVSFLAQSTKCPPEKNALETLASHDYEAKVSALRVSVLDLLEKFPSCQIKFGDFLGMLPLMQMRQYSISSTPLWNPDHVTLTVAVLD